MPFVTLIIPIYNAERYLRRCLDSVMEQTYADMEVLLMNDGSTDGSLAICREYEEKDLRFRTIDKENTGASSVVSSVASEAAAFSSVLLLPHPVSTPTASTPARTLAKTFLFIIFSSLSIWNCLLQFHSYLFSVVKFIGSLHSNGLENLEQNYQQHNCYNHDIRLPSGITISNGDSSQTSASDSS